MLKSIQNSYSFKKIYKKKIKGFKFNSIKMGVIAIRSLQSGRIIPNQLETIRKISVRITKRSGKFWLRVFEDQPLYNKPLGSRMGKGYGNLNLWVIDIKLGQILFEISVINIDIAKSIVCESMGKLPMRSEFIFKEFNYINNEEL